VLQAFSATDYRSQRVRFSALVKTSEIHGRGVLWMRVDAMDRISIAFDNMMARPITGTTDWKRYDIVLNVAPYATQISIGGMMLGFGQMWMDDIRIEKVDDKVPATDVPNNLPPGPQNLSLD
jgi:hypothetical protein